MTLWGSPKRLPDSGIFVYFSTPQVTTIAEAGTFQDIEGAFQFDVKENFISTVEYAEYIGTSNIILNIIWSGSFSCNTAGVTVNIGDAVNFETLTTASPTVMSTFVKFANETTNLGGNFTFDVAPGDKFQFQVTADIVGTEVSFEHFAVSAFPFF